MGGTSWPKTWGHLGHGGGWGLQRSQQTCQLKLLVHCGARQKSKTSQAQQSKGSRRRGDQTRQARNDDHLYCLVLPMASLIKHKPRRLEFGGSCPPWFVDPSQGNPMLEHLPCQRVERWFRRWRCRQWLAAACQLHQRRAQGWGGEGFKGFAVYVFVYVCLHFSWLQGRRKGTHLGCWSPPIWRPIAL